MKKEDIYVTRNIVSKEIFYSPSKKYNLVVTAYKTKEGSWNYTEGSVFYEHSYMFNNVPINRSIFISNSLVQRNYSSFPFLFIEDHPNGHDYLICGENYQGQTVVELDTGKRKDFLPKEAKKGQGFCWSRYDLDRDSMILTVDGCHWACPYEFRFFDFSNPMNGWPEIKINGYVDSSNIWPTITNSDDETVIDCYETYEELADRYTYEVHEENGKFVGTCKEFPELRSEDVNKRKALLGVELDVLQILDDLKDNGRVPPEPLKSEIRAINTSKEDQLSKKHER